MSWQTLTLIAATALFLFDFQNLASWWGGRTLSPYASSEDFTIVIPLYGHPRYFDERAQLADYKDRVLVAMDVTGDLMPAFADTLEAEGWRVLRTHVQAEMGVNPGPPSLMKLALDSGLIDSTYVVRMDADTAVTGDLRGAVAEMAADGADLCSVKVLARNAGAGFVTKFQALEYRMAMLSRHFRPWLASGACFVGRTEALQTILGLHTMNYLGEDVETGRIAHALKMRVRHLDIVVETEVPVTWLGLFKQRRLWWAGNFRHAILNLDRNLVQTPTWAFYYVALVWCGVSFKVWAIVPAARDPLALLATFGMLFMVYAVVTVVANWQVRSWWMLVFPPYALVQAILMPPIGLVWYVVMYRRSRNVGRYRFGYVRRRSRPISA